MGYSYETRMAIELYETRAKSYKGPLEERCHTIEHEFPKVKHESVQLCSVRRIAAGCASRNTPSQ